MGRVSRYKKIKAAFDNHTPEEAVWGFGDNGRKPKKRSAKAQTLRKKKLKRKRETGVILDDGFDLPPQGEDDFNLSDMKVRKQKPKKLDEGLLENEQSAATSGTGMRYVMPDTERDATKVARILKIDNEKEKNPASLNGRMEGESRGAFNRRVKTETRQIMKQETENLQNTAKRQRKKEFLNKKKKKRKGTSRHVEDAAVGSHQDLGVSEDEFVTGERAAAAASSIAFGEQVERPPVFQQLPRGAKAKGATKKNKNSSTATMSQQKIEAESKAMEIMRRKVQAQYALIKARRKAAGEFHL